MRHGFRELTVVAACAVAMGVAVACSTFEDASNPGGADGGDAAADGDPNASDGGADGGETCMREPIDPVDAGGEDASCVPGQLPVDLAGSRDHCGFCGNRCGPADQCTTGACIGEKLPGGDHITKTPPAIRGGQLYFSATNQGRDYSVVRRMPLEGAPVVEDVLGIPGQNTNLWVGVNGDRLFYLQEQVGIFSTSLASPQVNEGAFAGTNAAWLVHLASTHLFWMNVYANTLTMVTLDGASKEVLQEVTSPMVIRAFAGDGESAWWITGETGPTPTQPDVLRTRAAGSGTTNVRSPDLPFKATWYLAFDAEYVYGLTYDGDVYRLRKNDTSAPEPVTKIDADVHYPRGFAVVGDYVYAVIGNESYPTSGSVEIYRAKKCGGRARIIARDYLYDSTPTAAGKHLYLGRIGELGRLELTGR